MPKTYEYRATSDKDLFRVVDRQEDWTHYFYEPTKEYLRAVNFILRRGYPMGEGLIRFLKSNTEEEIEARLKRGGDRGDAIHQYIAHSLSGEEMIRETQVLSEDNLTPRKLTDDEWSAIKSFERFWNIHECKLVAHEKSVKNLTLKYAGTFDCILVLGKACESKYCGCKKFVGKIGLFDWKSGGGIYDDYGPQVSAYSHSDLTQFLGKKKIEYTAILQVGVRQKSNGGYNVEFYNSEETETHWEEFKAAIVNSNATYKPFDPAKEIYEIDETFRIKVEFANLKPEKKPRKKIKKVVKAELE